MTGAVRIGPPAASVCRPCATPLPRTTLSPHSNCAAQRGVCRIDQLLFPLPLTRRSSKAGAAAAVRGAGQIVDHPPFIRCTVYAAPGSFDRRGKAQGRRGYRHPPHRFARPPAYTKRRPQGAASSSGRLFFWTVHGPFSFRLAEKKMGGAFPGNLPVPAALPHRQKRAAPCGAALRV